MLNRTQAPAYQTLRHVHIPQAQTHRLDNGIALHVINVGDQPLVRLECVFQAGTWYESNKGASLFTSKMLNEGTATRTSKQISEYVDQFGAFLEFNHGVDKINVTVYTLVKYLADLLPLLRDILRHSNFPAKELSNVKKIVRQNLKVNLEKNSYVAGLLFRERVFGENHAYGANLTEEDIAKLERDTIREFYELYIHHNTFDIVLSGKVSESEIRLINQHLGQDEIVAATATTGGTPVEQLDFSPLIIEKAGSLQSSIRMGRRLFTRTHPDYLPLSVLNEVLGGYFGSRLMKNIREEKGFTYGISSNPVTLLRAGYWVIGTDVKKEFTRQTIEEIYKEMEILKTELIGEEELLTVKNYMTGSFAGSLHTPFDIADRFKMAYFDGLPADFYDHYIERIQEVTAEEVLRLANQYLDTKVIQEVIVGGV